MAKGGAQTPTPTSRLLRNGVGCRCRTGYRVMRSLPGLPAPTSAAGLGVGTSAKSTSRDSIRSVRADLWWPSPPRGDQRGIEEDRHTPQGGGAVGDAESRDSLKRGGRAPFIVKPGDVVYVTSTGRPCRAAGGQEVLSVMGHRQPDRHRRPFQQQQQQPPGTMAGDRRAFDRSAELGRIRGAAAPGHSMVGCPARWTLGAFLLPPVYEPR